MGVPQMDGELGVPQMDGVQLEIIFKSMIPQMDGLPWETLLQWMIWWCFYLWKPPFVYT